MQEEKRIQYSLADDREKYRLASENPEKIRAIEMILGEHPSENVLIIGQYLRQLKQISDYF